MPRKSRCFPFRDPGSHVCKCGHVRNSHNEDRPWERIGNTCCRRYGCDCQEFIRRKARALLAKEGGGK